MNVIYSTGSHYIDIPSGESLLVNAENATASVFYGTYPISPNQYYLQQELTNTAVLFGPFASDSKVLIQSQVGDVAYLVGSAPEMVVRYPDKMGIGVLNPTERLEILGNIKISGTYNGVDLDKLPTNLDDLTDEIVDQLAKIDTTVISEAQWVYLSELDQSLDEAASPEFASVTLTNSPSENTNAASKGYVDAVFTGGRFKDNCVVATTANITLSGEQTIDDVLTSLSRVLVWKQTDPAENGIYVSAAGAWSRAEDANTGAEIWGCSLRVVQGTLYGQQDFVNTNSTLPTLGVTGVTFADQGSAVQHNSTLGLQGGATGEYYHLDSSDNTAVQAMITAGVDGLTSDEVDQLKNIGAEVISATEWGYLAALDQSLTTASSVQFGGLTVQSSSGLVSSLYRTSSTVLDLSAMKFNLQDSASAEKTYGYIGAKIVANTPGAESGKFSFNVVNSGNFLEAATISETGDFNLPQGVYAVAGTQVVGPRAASVTAPAGGAVQDTECRTAIVEILSRLSGHGLIAA